MTTIIIHGPPACGKTRNRDALRAAFDAPGIVDGWDPRQRTRPGHLHLTCEAPPHGGNRYPGHPHAHVMDFDTAMTRVRQPSRADHDPTH